MGSLGGVQVRSGSVSSTGVIIQEWKAADAKATFLDDYDRTLVERFTHNYTVFDSLAFQDFSVCGVLKAIVSHMGCIVAGMPKPFRDRRREGVVDEESHDAAMRGILHSRTASAAKRRASATSSITRSSGRSTCWSG